MRQRVEEIETWCSQIVEIFIPTSVVWSVSLSVEKRGRRVSSGFEFGRSGAGKVAENRDVMVPDCRDFRSEFDGAVGFFVGAKPRAQGQIRF